MKKILITLLTLVIGLVAGYYYCKNFYETRFDYKASDLKDIKRAVSKKEMDNLINNYRIGIHPDKETCYGWISKSEIDRLTNDNNNADGLRIYLTRHYNTMTKYYQIGFVFVATKGKTGQTLDYTNSDDQLMDSKGKFNILQSYEGMGADDIPLCPTKCGDNTTNVTWPHEQK